MKLQQNVRTGKESGKELAEKEMRAEAHTLQALGVDIFKPKLGFQRLLK